MVRAIALLLAVSGCTHSIYLAPNATTSEPAPMKPAAAVLAKKTLVFPTRCNVTSNHESTTVDCGDERVGWSFDEGVPEKDFLDAYRKELALKALITAETTRPCSVDGVANQKCHIFVLASMRLTALLVTVTVRDEPLRLFCMGKEQLKQPLPPACTQIVHLN